jgi:hypothetical protein
MLVLALAGTVANATIGTSAFAQGAVQQSAARDAAMRRCNMEARRLYRGDQQGQNRTFSYAACMTAAGFAP